MYYRSTLAHDKQMQKLHPVRKNTAVCVPFNITRLKERELYEKLNKHSNRTQLIHKALEYYFDNFE